MTVYTENLRRTADFMKQASGVDPVWLREAADEIDRLRGAVEHAGVRFACLADDFKDDENNVNWAMCSVDAERMAKALALTNGDRQCP